MQVDWLGMLVAAIFVFSAFAGLVFLVLACISILVGAAAGGDYEDYPHEDDETYHHPKHK